jgi:hypothetical protein
VTLAAFRVRSFRFQFPADLLTSLAFEMETVILSWYVIAQTGSVLLLTAYGSLLYVGTLLSPICGVLGDRLGAGPCCSPCARSTSCWPWSSRS